jgi:hypothetical protein
MPVEEWMVTREESKRAAVNALTLYTPTTACFTAYADLLASGVCSAAAKDACSSGDSGKAHISLLVTFTIDARVLVELWVGTPELSHDHSASPRLSGLHISTPERAIHRIVHQV